MKGKGNFSEKRRKNSLETMMVTFQFIYLPVRTGLIKGQSIRQTLLLVTFKDVA